MVLLESSVPHRSSFSWSPCARIVLPESLCPHFREASVRLRGHMGRLAAQGPLVKAFVSTSFPLGLCFLKGLLEPLVLHCPSEGFLSTQGSRHCLGEASEIVPNLMYRNSTRTKCPQLSCVSLHKQITTIYILSPEGDRWPTCSARRSRNKITKFHCIAEQLLRWSISNLHVF